MSHITHTDVRVSAAVLGVGLSSVVSLLTVTDVTSLTPSELFYVRQHMPVPDLDGSCHRLTVLVEGEGERRLQLSVDELNRFKRQEVRAALMCAGNRRSEMNLVSMRHSETSEHLHWR